MKLYTLLFCLFLTLSVKVNAALFLEPYLGLGKSTSEEIEYPDVTFDSFSINPGLKVGTTTMLRLVSAGVDISHQSSNVETNFSEDDNLERMDYALFCGARPSHTLQSFGQVHSYIEPGYRRCRNRRPFRLWFWSGIHRTAPAEFEPRVQEPFLEQSQNKRKRRQPGWKHLRIYFIPILSSQTLKLLKKGTP